MILSPLLGMVQFLRVYNAHKNEYLKPATIQYFYCSVLYAIFVWELNFARYTRPILALMGINKFEVPLDKIKVYARYSLLMTFLLENLPLFIIIGEYLYFTSKTSIIGFISSFVGFLSVSF